MTNELKQPLMSHSRSDEIMTQVAARPHGEPQPASDG